MVELGLYDPGDTFWSRPLNVENLSRSEQDLLERLGHHPSSSLSHDANPGCPDSAVSYEDLMDFALDGPTLRSPAPINW